jgi:hypothetical protein
MFGRSKEVAYIFRAYDRFTRVSDRINRSTRKMRGNLGGVATVMAKLGTATAALGAAAATAATGGLLAVIRAGSRFQDELIALSSLTGEAGERLDYYQERALQLGKAWGISSPEILSAFTLIGSLNSELLKQPKTLGMVTDEVLRLATATGIELNTAVRVTVGGMNQMGEAADQASRYVNVLAAGEQIGAARLNEIAEALVNVGPIAAKAGLSFEEVNATLHVLAKKGIVGARAGTALRMVLLKLEKETRRQLRPSVSGLLPVLEIYARSLTDVASAQKVFGEEAANAALAIFQQIDVLRRFRDDMTGTDIATKRAAIMMERYSKRLAVVKVKIEDALIRTFLRLEPVLTRHIERFSDWLDTISSKDIDNFADSLGHIAKALSVLTMGVGKSATTPTWWEALVPASFTAGFRAPAPLFAGATAGGGQANVSIELDINAPAGVVEATRVKTAGQGLSAKVGTNLTENY